LDKSILSEVQQDTGFWILDAGFWMDYGYRYKPEPNRKNCHKMQRNNNKNLINYSTRSMSAMEEDRHGASARAARATLFSSIQ
jgi:hypothetical protein